MRERPVIVTFLVGFVFSFLSSMPIAGPIAVIVLGKGLDGKPRSGFLIALGAALAESVYAGLAFLGITAMLQRYPIMVPVSRLAGCLILTGLGVAFIARRPKKQEATVTEAPAASKSYASTDVGTAFLGFSVTALNPTLVVTWTAAVSAAESTGFLRVLPADALPFSIGVALGIVSWFATLLSLIGKWKRKVGASSVERLIRGMGFVLLVAGIGFGVRTVLVWNAAR